MEIECSDDEDQSDYGDHFVGFTDMVTVQERENPPSGGLFDRSSMSKFFDLWSFLLSGMPEIVVHLHL
ncbi:hypothetical protein CH06BL_09930 [Chromobacterium haemolyticum]|nr:hypothetical protein CH06BL_09930 [Chromobacterium haemolyticum]